jgi:hypothetical protein
MGSLSVVKDGFVVYIQKLTLYVSFCTITTTTPGTDRHIFGTSSTLGNPN